MHGPWLGTRRIAFIPTLDRNVDANPPADFVQEVERRVFYDPDPATGVDRSLRNYIHTVSYGKAALEAHVFPLVEAPDADTVGAGIRSLPPSHGYTMACVVVPSGGIHRTGFAWWHASPVNGVEDFARVNLQEGLGVWGMEILHIATEFGDLYNTNPHLDRFDNMACACGTHPSAHTKLAMQWLDSSTVATHGGGTSSFNLHAIALLQPPPPGRVAAVRIPSQVTSNHFMVEARLNVDPYEMPSFASSGIPSAGVIVYEVAERHEVYLRTPVALSVGQTFETGGAEGLDVSVSQSIPGGFSIVIRKSTHSECQQILQAIQLLEELIPMEEDFFRRRQLISSLQRKRARARQLGCRISFPGTLLMHR